MPRARSKGPISRITFRRIEKNFPWLWGIQGVWLHEKGDSGFSRIRVENELEFLHYLLMVSQEYAKQVLKLWLFQSNEGRSLLEEVELNFADPSVDAGQCIATILADRLSEDADRVQIAALLEIDEKDPLPWFDKDHGKSLVIFNPCCSTLSGEKLREFIINTALLSIS